MNTRCATGNVRSLTRALALVTVAAGSSIAAAGANHEVIVRDFEFDPAEITVAPGETIRWVWESGFHTVTSGTDCNFDGKYFNAPMSVGTPQFEFTIPADIGVDEIDYLCLPHCKNMIGLITIERMNSEPADFNGDGEVNVLDLLTLLSAWGDCDDCSEDLTDDQTVNVLDLLELLSAWG